MTPVGLPAQVAALRKELADARAEVLAELGLQSAALGDVLHALDGIRDCVRVVLKLTKHLHTLVQKVRDAARTNR